MQDIIESLTYIYGEVFWLKETLITIQSFVLILLVWWFTTLKYKKELLLFLSGHIGVACSFFGDLGYWNDNDTLKHIAPATLFLIKRNNKNWNNHTLLLIFLVPFLIITYELYRSLNYAFLSIIIHLVIVLFVVATKSNKYLSLFVGIAIGLSYIYIGDVAEPGTNDILVNPVLITLAIQYIGFYTKNNQYTYFLTYYWIVLLCFAYFGGWIFLFVGDFYT